jgi:hypothetical protein
VGKDLADDGGLGDEAHDAHPLAAMASEGIDLVDATNQACLRFPAGRKSDTIGSRRLGRLVPRRNLGKSSMAPYRLRSRAAVTAPIPAMPG